MSPCLRCGDLVTVGRRPRTTRWMGLMVVLARDDGCSADVDKWVDQGRLVEVDLTVLDGDVAVEYGRDG